MTNIIPFVGSSAALRSEETPRADLTPEHPRTTRGVTADESCRVFGGNAPAGYASTPSGLYMASGDDDPVWICSPLRVTSIFRNHDGTGWGRLVSVQNPEGQWHEVPFLESELGRSAPPVIAKLNNLGLRIAPDKTAKQLVIAAIQAWEPDKRQISVEHLGWADQDCSAFVLPNGQVIGDQDILPMPAILSHTRSAAHAAGSTDDWVSQIGKKCRGNPLMTLAVSVALSGPLIEFLGLEMGTGVHFRGVSSCGKTTGV